jgi:hypothetical protein
MKISKKKLGFVLIGLGIVTVSSIGFAVWNNSGTKQRGPKPSSTSESSFILNEVYYDCSQPVQGNWVEASIGQLGDPGYYFQPTNQQEFRRYCRESVVIEYRAVIDILKREDVSSIIAKYDTTQASVRALGHKYINDKDYLKRILPAYSDIKIDCIIVVHSPEGTRFFVENGEKHESHADHQYIEVPAEEFLGSLNDAPDADVTAFWLGLH